MTWLSEWIWWIIGGIICFFVMLFFVSCAWLNHFLDGIEEDDDKGDWY